VQDDFENLLISALAVAERQAHVLVSTNCSALSERALKVMARYCLKETRKAAAFQRPLPLPDFAARTGASSIWLALR
jgi:23S rRNA G2069 N7-methylase RlmK/C1962 C5-methylase RlmI